MPDLSTAGPKKFAKTPEAGEFVRQEDAFRDWVMPDKSSRHPAEAGRYHLPGIADTVNFDHIKRHYYYTHDDINPTRIVPIGPALNL